MNEKEEQMNSKPNGGSILHGLTPEQREKVDGWLFDENNSYPKVAERCREELGVQLSRSSVARYYERECVSRKLERMARHAGTKKRVLSALEDPEEDYKIVVGLAGQLATAEALKPEEHTDLGRIGQATKLMIAARKEKHE